MRKEKAMFKLIETMPEVTIMDGPYAQKQFRHGEKYESFPPELASCFEVVEEPTTTKTSARTTKARDEDKGGAE